MQDYVLEKGWTWRIIDRKLQLINLNLTILLLCQQSTVKATNIVIEPRLIITHFTLMIFFSSLAFRHVYGAKYVDLRYIVDIAE